MESRDPYAGFYFRSLQEADEWLDFEADADEQERAFYKENDRFEEWQGYWLPIWETLIALDLTPDEYLAAMAA